MHCVLLTKTAVLFKLYSVGSVFFVFLGIIIALFALCTCQSYADSHDFLPLGCFMLFAPKSTAFQSYLSIKKSASLAGSPDTLYTLSLFICFVKKFYYMVMRQKHIDSMIENNGFCRLFSARCSQLECYLRSFGNCCVRSHILVENFACVSSIAAELANKYYAEVCIVR